MALNKSTGNMYSFVTHTLNFIKGKCFHDCLYCFMKFMFNIALGDICLDEKEFKTNLGSGRFIFVGSSTDMWAMNVPSEWIRRVLDRCHEFTNRYLFQSKNPLRFLEFLGHEIFQSGKAVLCTTLETNRWYPDFMCNAPRPEERVQAMAEIASRGIDTFVTCEPLMDFDLDEMVAMLRACQPKQVNIGRNSVRQVHLPEPDDDKVKALIAELKTFTTVHVKSNATCWK